MELFWIQRLSRRSEDSVRDESGYSSRLVLDIPSKIQYRLGIFTSVSQHARVQKAPSEAPHTD